MIEIKRAEECCGCSACEERCPKQCILMKEDAEGFRYPEVDKERCIECGLCEKVCPVLHPLSPVSHEEVDVYACINRDAEVRKMSSSGGLFSLLAAEVLAAGGAVFGAQFDRDFSVCHAMAENEAELAPLRGSKYVQSRLKGMFRQAEKMLKEGRKVLFTGTSCQIAGLRRFLGREYDNLLAVDVLCHGVPSGRVWARYLDQQCQRVSRECGEALQLERLSFRDKSSRGWGRYCVVREYVPAGQSSASHKVVCREELPFTHDMFMRGFLHDLYLRPSCYECPARGLRAGSDLTLADYWGIGKFRPEMDDNGGTSLVVVQSERGRKAFAAIADRLHYCPTPFEQALPGNPCLVRSVHRPRARRRFFALYEQAEDLAALISQMTRQPFVKRLKRKVRGVCHTLKNKLTGK